MKDHGRPLLVVSTPPAKQEQPGGLRYQPLTPKTYHVFYGEGGEGTFFGSVANLANAAVGAGILCVPFAFAKAGAVVGLLLNGAFCLLVLFMLHVTGRAQKRTNTGTFQQIVSEMLGAGWSRGVIALQLAFLCGGCVAMQCIVADQVLPLLKQEGFPGARREVVLVLNAYGVLLPLAFIRNIQRLSPLATFSMASVGYALVMIVVRALEAWSSTRSSTSKAFPPLAWSAPAAGSITMVDANPLSLLQAIPIFTFAYNIHPTYPLVFAELARPKTLTQMDRATAWAFGGCFTLYTLCGLSGIYLCAVASPAPVFPVPGDILTIWEVDGDATDIPLDVMVAKVAISVSVISSFTTLHFAARTCFEDLLLGGAQQQQQQQQQQQVSVAEEGEGVGGGGGSPGYNGGPRPQPHFSARGLALENVLFVSATMGVALAVQQLDVVLNFTGALCCMPFMFCLPGMLLRELDRDSESPVGSLKWRHNGTLAVVFGSVMCVVTTATAVMDAAGMNMGR